MVSQVVEVNKRGGISGSTLKLIAIITMLIDHTAATILDNILITRGMNNLNASNTQAVQEFFINNGLLYRIDMIMRMIGRLSFPIFCFLLVEGFIHTRNAKKYALRLAAFALVSEIPFDLAFHNTWFNSQHQNVFFTLLIGLLVLIGFKTIGERLSGYKWLPVLAMIGSLGTGFTLSYAIGQRINSLQSYVSAIGSTFNLTVDSLMLIGAILFSSVALFLYAIMCKATSLKRASVSFTNLAVLVVGIFLAEAMMTDYSGWGVLTIAVMYGLRSIPTRAMLGGGIVLTVMSSIEFTSFADLILIRFYNGSRGLNLRYIFYAFYPVHLFILYLICYAMKII